MALIIDRDCFQGYFLIKSSCYGYSRLTSFIEKFETKYLCYLLDSENLEALKTDLNDNGEITLDWALPFCEDTENPCCDSEKIVSEGLKSMLTGFIYYHFTHGSQMKQSLSGVTISEDDNATVVDLVNAERDAEDRYNESVTTYKAIRKKLGLKDCNEIDYKFLDLI